MLGSIPRRPSERTKPSSSSRARVSTSGPAPWTFEACDERVDGGRPEGGVDLLVDRGADPPLDVGAQLGQRVELARGARQLVVDLRQHLLVHVLDRDRHRGAGLVGELVVDLLRLPHARADQRRLDLLDEPAGAELDDGVRLRLARRALQVDDERVARPGRAIVGRHELRDGLPQRLELLVDELLRNLGLGARHLERRPVDDLGRRLHLDRGRERPRLLVGRRQLEVVLGRRDRAQPRARRRRPEPAADVRLDRLDPDPVLADLRDEHRRRHLPLAEAGDLDRLGEVVRRVLDRVLELVRRHVHRQADAILAELFHLRRHPWPFKQTRYGLPQGCRSDRSVRRGSYPRRMVLGIVVFGAVFLVGLALGTVTRRPLATASLVVAAFVAVLVVQTHEPLAGVRGLRAHRTRRARRRLGARNRRNPARPLTLDFAYTSRVWRNW